MDPRVRTTAAVLRAAAAAPDSAAALRDTVRRGGIGLYKSQRVQDWAAGTAARRCAPSSTPPPGAGGSPPADGCGSVGGCSLPARCRRLKGCERTEGLRCAVALVPIGHAASIRTKIAKVRSSMGLSPPAHYLPTGQLHDHPRQ
eukprot:gene15432-biopygen7522